MEEIRIRDEQLTDLDAELSVLFEGLEESARKELDLDEIKDKIHEYGNALDSFKFELRSQAPANRSLYKEKAKKFKSNLRKYKSDLKWQETQNTRDQLFDGATAGGADEATAEGYMKKGLDIQQQSKESLQRSAAKVAETQQIGRETAVKLAQQTKQLEKVADDLDSIESTLARSTKIIKRMARKVSTDKYIWVLVFLVLCAIVGIIGYKLTNPEADVTEKDSLNNARRLLELDSMDRM
jgi:preprotein translocase subunit Sss1